MGGGARNLAFQSGRLQPKRLILRQGVLGIQGRTVFRVLRLGVVLLVLTSSLPWLDRVEPSGASSRESVEPPSRRSANDRSPARQCLRGPGSGDCLMETPGIRRPTYCTESDWTFLDSTRSRHPSAGMATARWFRLHSLFGQAMGPGSTLDVQAQSPLPGMPPVFLSL